MSCPHCERMEAEIAHLQSELGLRRSDGEIGAIMSRLDVTPTWARLLRAMYSAKGRVVSHAFLTDMLPFDGEKSSLTTTLCKIRKKIGANTIETITGMGYALTPEGMSLVMAAMYPVELQEPRPV